jgi:putative zinc finger protein
VLDLVAARTPADCGRAEALMAARAAGNISPDSRRLLSFHLDSCASCALVAGSLDAPEIADTLASAADLDRSLDGPVTAAELGSVAGSVHGVAPVQGAGARRGESAGGARPRRVVLAGLALLAIAAVAALLTRALG